VEHLTLTPQGISAYEDLRETARQYDGRLLKALGKKEGKVLRKALIKLMQAEQSRFT
jgi:DNA-binding MarR family transcriptional regulator